MSTVEYNIELGGFQSPPPVIPPAAGPPKSLHRISEVRQEQGVSVRSAARRLGLSMQEVRAQENPTADLRLSQLHQWQQVLEVPLPTGQLPTPPPDTATPTLSPTPAPPTNTPLPTDTPTITQTPTQTGTPTNTPTVTETPTATLTPTPTSTRVPIDVGKVVYTSLPPVFVGASILLVFVIVAAGLSVVRGPRDI